MYKIAIIEEFHESGLELLKKHSNFEFEIINDTSEENLIKKLPKFDGCTLRVSKLYSNVLKHCKKLKVISRHGVGYDNVDLEYIKKNNITLLITATTNALAVAEHVMYMILSISKGITSHDHSVRTGLFKEGVKDIQTLELFNKEILILGFGRIGKELIKRCQGFSMKINVFDPYVNSETIKSLGGKKITDLDKGLASADYVSLHIPLSEKTKNLLNYKKLKTMKKTAILINTSRGGVINEMDLNKALNERLIFGAGLDVFEKEPVNLNNPLLKNKKILLSPHSATFTDECKIRMAKQTVQNIIDFFEKKIDKSMVVK
tara:strand:+ start:51 stop:1004 length:954 start_codon:yes stop_codon:yes gene_type:complete